MILMIQILNISYIIYVIRLAIVKFDFRAQKIFESGLRAPSIRFSSSKAYHFHERNLILFLSLIVKKVEEVSTTNIRPWFCIPFS